MADPKSKTAKPVKAETDTTQTVAAQDLAAAEPTTALPAAADPAAPAVATTELTTPAADMPAKQASDAGLAATALLAHVGLDAVWSVYGQTCQAAVDVLKERCRQVEEEGYDLERDDAYTDYQLPRAAVCYAIKAGGLPSHRATLYWPFAPVAFKPANRRGNLVKAAALLLAEIERLDRAELAAD